MRKAANNNTGHKDAARMTASTRGTATLTAAIGFLAVVTALGVWWINSHYDTREVTEKSAIKHNLTIGEFAIKQQNVEQAFRLMYQSIRTISLFPGVRDIKGGNRLSEAEDVVQSGRFSADAHDTVQALYDNLAHDVSISEIYAVVDGLRGDRGEFPFFMYDSLILNRGAAQADDDGRKRFNPDQPAITVVKESAQETKTAAALLTDLVGGMGTAKTATLHNIDIATQLGGIAHALTDATAHLSKDLRQFKV